MRFEVEITFRSKSTAEQRDDDADVRLREVEGAGDARTRRKRDLGRRPNGHLSSLPLGKDCPWLDGSALRGVRDIATLDHHLGVGHGGGGITLDDRRVAKGVAPT